MDKFSNQYHQFCKHTTLLKELEETYKNKNKGSIYQERRAKYRRAIDFYLHGIRDTVIKPSVREYTGKINGKSFRINTVDMNYRAMTLFLELITKKKVTELKSKEIVIGTLEILD